MSQVAVRVKDIILNIEHPQAINFGGYDAIGTIFFTKLDVVSGPGISKIFLVSLFINK